MNRVNSGGSKKGLWSRAQRIARWIARHELWLLAAAAPFFLFPGDWTFLAFIVVVASWLCRWIASGRPTASTPGDVPIALMLFMSIIGLYASVDPSASLSGLWRIVLGVAVFYACVNGLRGEARLRSLPLATALLGLVLAVISLIGTEWDAVRFFRLPQLYDRLPRLLRDIQDQNAFHPRIMGMALAAWFPIPLAVLLFGSRRHRALSGVTVLLMGLTLLLTQSVQAAVGVACALLFLGALWNRWVLLSVPLMVAAFLLGLLIYGPQQAASALLSFDHPLGIALVLRLDMWSRALAMIGDMPYTGIGLDAFPVIQSNFYTGLSLGPEPHAHSAFLQIALDLGIPGLFAFLWLLLGLGYAAFKAYPKCQNPDQRALVVGAVGGGMSYVASGLLDTIWTAKPSVLLWLLVGLVAALSVATDRPEKPRASRTLPALLRQYAPLLLLVLLLYPGLLVARGGPELNLAAIRAHKVLLSAQAGESPSTEALSSVAEDLRRAARTDVADAHLYDLLGRVLAWLGEYPTSLEAFRMEVEIDSEDPIARYAPYESLRRRFAAPQQHDRWEDTVRVYSPRMNRFPQRAESYVLIALVRAEYQDKPQAAAAVLSSGIERGAQPLGLLEYYLQVIRKAGGSGSSSKPTPIRRMLVELWEV